MNGLYNGQNKQITRLLVKLKSLTRWLLYYKLSNFATHSLNNGHIMSIYTRKGDDGTTALSDKKRVRKDDQRIETYGTIDELNACNVHIETDYRDYGKTHR